MPAERRAAVVHGVDRAARRVSRGDREQRLESDDAEAHLLPFHVALANGSSAERAELRQQWVAVTSPPSSTSRPATNRIGHDRPERPALPRRRTMLPNVWVNARRDQQGSYSTSTKLLSGVGFSNGSAELALKKPPPLVPSCLMASWMRIGLCAMTCLAPSSVVAST